MHVSHLAPVSPSSPLSSQVPARGSHRRAPGEAMRVLLVHLALLMALTWSTGLYGCGLPTPGASANTKSSSVAMAGPSNAPAPASERSSQVQVAATPPSDSPSRPSLTTEPRPDVPQEPVPLPEDLILPEWIATALDSPDVRVRLRALDRWTQQGPTTALDPLIVALDDDDHVRERAMELVERARAAEQEREAERGGTR